jgi:hypothetical protein
MHNLSKYRVVQWISKNLLLVLFTTSLLISIPSILRIPRFIPFLRADVRSLAVESVDMLRGHGMWVINADVRSVREMASEQTETDNEILCMEWEYRYRSRFGDLPVEIVTMCNDEGIL